MSRQVTGTFFYLSFQYYRCSDGVQVVNNFSIFDCHLTLKFFVTLYFGAFIVEESKFTFTNIKDSNVGNSASR